jgi:hypothetical protein
MAAVRRVITTIDRSYTALNAERVPTSGLVITRVVDAPSGRPRKVRGVSTTAKFAFAHIASGGYLVITGRPELVMPTLATQPQDLPVRILFYDLPPLDLVFTIPAGSALPFRPPEITVQPFPTSVTGIVTAAAFPHAAIADAEITVGALAPPPDYVALRTPLAAEHSQFVNVRERTLTVAAAATTLSEPATAGGNRIRLLSIAGCTTANGVIVLGEETTAEHVRITAIDVPTKELTLAAPLRRTRLAGAPAQAFTITGTGALRSLSRAAVPGDGVLLVSGAVAPGVIEVAGAPPELRATGVVSGPDGRWRLDGVRSIGRLTVTVQAAGFLTLGPFPYDVDYRLPNVIDLSLTV